MGDRPAAPEVSTGMGWWIVAAVLLAGAPALAAEPGQAAPRPAAAAQDLRVDQLGVSVDRIRRELEAAPPTPILDELNRPRFRLTVQGEWLIGLPPWVSGQPDAVAPWVKPNMPLTQFEYLRMNVPEEFRSGALYPMGTAVNMGSLWGGIAQSIRSGRAKKTRAQIEEELRQLDALTRKPPPE
jgi:hypothetical protein